jgi:hypothetical protein
MVTKNKNWEVSGMFAGFRIDTRIIEARDTTMARKKFRNGYKKKYRKDVTDVKVSYAGEIQ